MRVSRILSTVVASAATLGAVNFGFSALSDVGSSVSSAFAEDEPAAVAESGAPDFDPALFDVKAGEKAEYYQTRMNALNEAAGKLAQKPDGQKKLEAIAPKARAAFLECLKNLADSEELPEQQRDACFMRYASQLEYEGRVDELKKYVDDENASLARRVDARHYIYLARINAAAKNADELAKIGDEIVAFADDDFRSARSAEQLALTFRNIDKAVAGKVLQKLGDAFVKSGDEQLAELAKELEGILRFLDLVGNEMKVEGVFLDGSEIDWPSYRGKVVLIDFWATWCPPCVGEIPNVRKLYEKYNKAGFEVVGYSLDSDLDALKKFEEEKKLPWKTASRKMSRDAEKDYLDLTQYYGVESIPTMILVGKDGKVLDTNARGERLRALLEKQFPEVK